MDLFNEEKKTNKKLKLKAKLEERDYYKNLSQYIIVDNID